MGWHACSVISGKVVEQRDLGTHTLFIAEVTDAKMLNDNAPLTYADYQNRVKPKKKEISKDKKIIGWRCKICNYVYEVNCRQITHVLFADTMQVILNRYMRDKHQVIFEKLE